MRKRKIKIFKMFHDFINILIFVLVCAIIIYCLPLSTKSFEITPKKNLKELFEARQIVKDNKADNIELGTTSKEATTSSADVLLIGNSNLYSGYNALEAYHDYGIISYVAAGPRQTMAVSYAMYEEYLSVHKPKFLIIETDNFYEKNQTKDISSAKNLAISNMWPVFKDTKRWDNISLQSYTKSTNPFDRVTLYGFVHSSRKQPNSKGNSYIQKTEEKEDLNTYNYEYLMKMIELAKSIECRVLFLTIPSSTSWNYKRHNAIQVIADKNNIPYLDLNLKTEDISLDWNIDTRDGGQHLNYLGAKKVTKWISEYLKDVYTIPDGRHNKKYVKYQQDYEQYKRLTNK